MRISKARLSAVARLHVPWLLAEVTSLQSSMEVAQPDSNEQTTVSRGRMSRGAKGLLFAAVAIQVFHLGLHLLVHLPMVRSYAVQALAATLTAAVCYYKSRQESQYRRLWVQLAMAFVIWTVAQVFWAIAASKPGVTDLSFSNMLWLVYAFPMLRVTMYVPNTTRRDLAGWFDAAQAYIFFSILIALFFPAPGIISQAISDDVQGLAMLLALVLRYCTTAPGRDRVFFRNLTIYMAVYVGFCILYYAAISHGFAFGSIAELCWTIPFTLFSVLALCTDLSSGGDETEWSYRSAKGKSSYLQGISALGLAIMSMMAAAVLAYHKPILGGVALAVTFLMFSARMIAREWQLDSLHSRVNHSALHDPLTSVANRTMLEAEITRRLARAGLKAESTAVLFLGLDRFKTLNDCLGHAFGDLLLQRVAAILCESVRKQDLVARYGGDEFVILLDAANVREAEAFGEHLLAILRVPQYLEGRLLHVTASIGLVSGRHAANAAAMLQDAHFAMHHAKRSGRDRVQVFEEEMVRVPLYKLGLETDLRAALEVHEIEVFYQPIFAVDGGEVRGFEALARWTHEKRGVVSPSDFIPVAEDTGLILELGAQVMRKACQQCHDWNARFGTAYTMNVNVSACQFERSNVMELVVSVLQETGLEPRFLKLEVTESVLLTGHSPVRETLAWAQKLGIKICLDDFGTGYSSLSYLLKYPFDVVKIDQSFVRRLDKDPQKANLVRILVDLALSLNKQLVAEGVERPEEIECLRKLGCELMQGFLPSKPLPVDVATAFLEAHLDRERKSSLVVEEA
jgi:diguanylate cyclase (GGDEF)-like protein